MKEAYTLICDSKLQQHITKSLHMNFVDLVEVFKNKTSADLFVQSELPGVPLEQVDTYFKNAPGTQAEVRFFDAENTPGYLKIEVDGALYINLFSYEMLQAMVEGLADEGHSNMEIAERIISYSENDA